MTNLQTNPERGKMLPGVAGIALFLLFLTAINVYGAMIGAFGAGVAKYGILALCTLLTIGVSGLLRMKRWGWAMALAGTLLLFAGNIVSYRMNRQGSFLVQGFFGLVFFLYLVRPEVRDRML